MPGHGLTSVPLPKVTPPTRCCSHCVTGDSMSPASLPAVTSLPERLRPARRAGQLPSARAAANILPACVIEISNACVSTSGNVEQFVEIGGTRYSHIIDLHTGLGLTAHRAATVIAPNCTRSDALATALCIKGKKGLSMINSLPHTEAVLFTQESGGQSSTRSRGFAAFIRTEN